MDEKNKAVAAEKKKLLALFKDADKNKKKLCDRLIDNCAFMAVLLAELMLNINASGVKEEYVNGANQYGYKDSVEVKTYNTLIKNYLSALKQLNEIMPVQGKGLADEFERFNTL